MVAKTEKIIRVFMATVVDSNICWDLMPFDGKSTPFIRNEKAKNRQYGCN